MATRRGQGGEPEAETNRDQQEADEAARLEQQRADLTAERAAEEKDLAAKREAEAVESRATETKAAQERKGASPDVPSTVQVADPSSSMSRVPDEGEPPTGGEGTLETAVPGQPPMAVYPDRAV